MQRQAPKHIRVDLISVDLMRAFDSPCGSLSALTAASLSDRASVPSFSQSASTAPSPSLQRRFAALTALAASCALMRLSENPSSSTVARSSPLVDGTWHTPGSMPRWALEQRRTCRPVGRPPKCHLIATCSEALCAWIRSSRSSTWRDARGGRQTSATTGRRPP